MKIWIFLMSSPPSAVCAEISRQLYADLHVHKLAHKLAHRSTSEIRITYQRVESEEAQVWRARYHSLTPQETGDERCIWIKRQKTVTRAQREADVLTQWAHSLGGPRLIGWGDQQTLILEDVNAQPISEMLNHWGVTYALGGFLAIISPLFTTQLAQQITALHHIEFDDDDPIPLANALRQRATRTLEQSIALTRGPQALMERARAQLTELISDTQIYEKQRISELTPLYTRVPCHRDLRPDHIYLSDRLETESTQRLRVIDWGQSRPDARVVEWARFYLSLSAIQSGLMSGPCIGSPEKVDPSKRMWREAWRTYLDLNFTQIQRIAAERQLRQLTALEALNTLIWADQHRDSSHIQRVQVVWERGLRDLRSWAQGMEF